MKFNKVLLIASIGLMSACGLFSTTAPIINVPSSSTGAYTPAQVTAVCAQYTVLLHDQTYAHSEVNSAFDPAVKAALATKVTKADDNVTAALKILTTANITCPVGK